MGRFSGIDQLAIRTVGDVEQADVVVLAVETAGGRLVHPLKPVRADDVRVGDRVLDVIAVRDAALLLARSLAESGRHAAAGSPEVELADDDRTVDQPPDLVNLALVDGVPVAVEAVYVEQLRRFDDLDRR